MLLILTRGLQREKQHKALLCHSPQLLNTRLLPLVGVPEPPGTRSAWGRRHGAAEGQEEGTAGVLLRGNMSFACAPQTRDEPPAPCRRFAAHPGAIPPRAASRSTKYFTHSKITHCQALQMFSAGPAGFLGNSPPSSGTAAIRMASVDTGSVNASSSVDTQK